MTILKKDATLSTKTRAATKALDYIQNGMYVGLGTGSTANIFIDLLSEKVKKENLKLHCVATSKASYERTVGHSGLILYQESEIDHLDIAIDGADEFDPQQRLIKGGGGALLREKMIAQAADKFIVIADNSKAVDVLGKFPLPVECLNFETKMLFRQLSRVFEKHADPSADDFVPVYRKNKENSSNFLTDLGHNIVDLKLKKISDPECLARDLQDIPGIVDHGLFLNETDVILTDSN